jgi:hypothetical protein
MMKPQVMGAAGTSPSDTLPAERIKVIADNQQVYYDQGSLIHFTLVPGPGYAIRPNSIRLHGKLNLHQPSGLARAEMVEFLDPAIGFHALIDEINTKTTLQGYIEQKRYYGRAVAAEKLALFDPVGDYYDSEMAVTGQTTSYEKAVTLLYGEQYGKGAYGYDPAATVLDPPSFAFKPDFVLNNTGNNVNYSQTGPIQVSFRLNQFATAFTRHDPNAVGSTQNFYISNVSLSFMRMPATDMEPAIAYTTETVVQTLQSAKTMLYCRQPYLTSGVSLLMYPVGSYSDLLAESFRSQDMIKMLQRSRYFFLNETNSKFAYEITDKQEMLEAYLQSFRALRRSGITFDTIRSESGSGIGYYFNGQRANIRDFNLEIDLDFTGAPASRIPSPTNQFDILILHHAEIVIGKGMPTVAGSYAP